MKLELLQADMVVVARQSNPSIIIQYWLIKNGILFEEDFLINRYIF